MSTSSERILAYDRARALAVIGMVFVNSSNIMGLCTIDPRWANDAIDFICGRAAVVFVMLAGAGIVLAYDRTPTGTTAALRGRLLKRAGWLLVAGIMLMQVWDADILHFYAAYFLIGVMLLDWTGARLKKALAAVALLSIPVCAMLAYDYEGGEILGDVNELKTPVHFLWHYFTSMYYPVLPWFGFFLTGMLLGRMERMPSRQRYLRLLVSGVVVCAAIEVFSTMLNAETIAGRFVDLSDPLWRALTVSEAFPTNPLFVFSAGACGVALIALCRLLPGRLSPGAAPGPLVAFGRLSLTLYVFHILLCDAYYRWVKAFYGNATSGQMLSFTMGYILGGMVLAAVWTRRFKRGPLESVMDSLTRLPFRLHRKPLPVQRKSKFRDSGMLESLNSGCPNPSPTISP